jgi:hypothetical protein
MMSTVRTVPTRTPSADPLGFAELSGIGSLFAPDPDSAFDYLAASSKVGLPLIAVRKLLKAKLLKEKGEASVRVGSSLGSDAEIKAGNALLNQSDEIINEVLTTPGVTRAQIDEVLNPSFGPSDLTKEQQLNKLQDLRNRLGKSNKKMTREERNPDYPNRLLSDKLTSNDVAKILEEHGFVEAQQYGKRLGIHEYEFTDDGKIIAYETTKDLLGKPSTTQRTFDSPTLKRIRNYLGY